MGKPRSRASESGIPREATGDHARANLFRGDKETAFGISDAERNWTFGISDAKSNWESHSRGSPWRPIRDSRDRGLPPTSLPNI